MSRCIKSIPSRAENVSKFLVGSYTTNNSYLHKVCYDAEKNDITTTQVINFEEMEKNGKIINEVNGIYNSISVEDSLNTSASKEYNIFVQVFNQTDDKHQLKMIKSLDADEEMTYMAIKASDIDHIFE